MRDDSPAREPDYGYEITRRPPGACIDNWHEYEQADRFNRTTNKWEYYGPITCIHCGGVLELRTTETTEHPANY